MCLVKGAVEEAESLINKAKKPAWSIRNDIMPFRDISYLLLRMTEVKLQTMMMSRLLAQQLKYRQKTLFSISKKAAVVFVLRTDVKYTVIH